MPGAVLPASHVLIPRWPLTTTRARRGRITSKVTQIITITGRRTQLNPHGLGSGPMLFTITPHISLQRQRLVRTGLVPPSLPTVSSVKRDTFLLVVVRIQWLASTLETGWIQKVCSEAKEQTNTKPCKWTEILAGICDTIRYSVSQRETEKKEGRLQKGAQKWWLCEGHQSFVFMNRQKRVNSMGPARLWLPSPVWPGNRLP